MGDQNTGTRQWRRVGAVLVCAAIAVVSAGTPAQAYSEKKWNESRSVPYMVYEKNNRSTLNSKLTAYVSLGSKRYRLSMRGGSGTGVKSNCVRNKGQLPPGFYDPRDEDRGSTLKYVNNKTWGSSVVRGAVWQLGSKKCIPSSGESRITRTELYIHSQGSSGWSGNYRSNGCIKISQTDRGQLKKRWKAAWKRDRGMLMVY